MTSAEASKHQNISSCLSHAALYATKGTLEKFSIGSEHGHAYRNIVRMSLANLLVSCAKRLVEHT